MKAVRCYRFAALDPPKIDKIKSCLSLDTNIPKPKATKKGDILIQTHYAGIQYPDFLQAQGLYQIKPKLPYIPGLDVTGVISESLSDSFQKGDRVFATTIDNGGTGALAEYCVVNEKNCWKVPDEIENLAECANLGRNYFASNHSVCCAF